MAKQNEGADPNGDSDSALFERLLESAARVSGPTLSSLGVRLRPGTELLGGRLCVTRRIGEGGMGIVYEAFDDNRRSAVALKTLSRLDADGVYRLKNEFRSLADVNHPSLCRLHELFGDGDDWFFTMELVHGERFDRWVRPDGECDEPRLRAATRQLFEGIAAIHAAEKLHRDLKPSNVLVSQEGRVVVLDFGLAVDRSFGGVGQTVLDHGITGTPAYMAPEQAAGEPATPASDFYALGVMLFEALTGRLPFEGSVLAMLSRKQSEDAPRVLDVAPAAPADLAALCDALLKRAAAARPDRDTLHAALGEAQRWSAPPADRSSAPPSRELLLGRERELGELRSAYHAMLRRQAVVMFVSGESGMGKSALVGHFLDDVRAEGQAVVLAGRCYERENVPFKAFDAVVDDLSRYLRKLTRQDAGDLMPRDVFALVRLFPILERIRAIADAPKKDILDLQELQQRAFAALGELLGRIRDRRPLIVYIDDLQWTDRDSTALLESLLAQSDPAPMLVIVSHRSEGASDNPLLQQAQRAARRSPRIDVRALPVEALSAEATLALAQRMLGGVAQATADAVAREAQGSPFFVSQLVRQARLTGGEVTQLTLRQAVVQHVSTLSDTSRALLDVLAVAGRPLPVQLALDAARAPHDAVDTLVSEYLARVASAGHERTLECYHDKIREGAVDTLLPAALARVHLQLAESLVRHPNAEPDQLALHFHGAGDNQRAAAYFEQAGDLSAGGPLAFERAARQYQQALLVGSYHPEARGNLRAKLAGALAAAGLSRDAAYAYQEASIGASPEQALERKRSAAHYLMTSGHVDEGMVLLGEVLKVVGLSLPRSRRSALAAALWSRARLSMRGLSPRERSGAGAPSRETEARLSALWTVVQGSSGCDPFVMVNMSARYAMLALDESSLPHAARALAMEAYLVSFDGVGTRARTDALLEKASELAHRASRPEILGWVQEIIGNALVHQGRFVEGRAALGQAIEYLQQRCTAVAFELSSTRVYRQIACNHLGDFAEMSATTPGLVEDAVRRGDVYQANLLGTGNTVPAWLAHRGPEEAKARFEEAKRHVQPQSSYQWSDFVTLMGELSVALYEGTTRGALRSAAGQWPALESSQLLRMHIGRAMMLYLRGGAALVIVREVAAGAAAELALVRAEIKQLRATRVPHARGFAAVLEAGLALREAAAERAAERLREAITAFDGSAMKMHAAAARRRLGQLVQGDEGRELAVAGDATMLSEATIDLDATTEMLTPGCRTEG